MKSHGGDVRLRLDLGAQAPEGHGKREQNARITCIHTARTTNFAGGHLIVCPDGRFSQVTYKETKDYLLSMGMTRGDLSGKIACIASI